jgi:S-formylglutathione hydrolase FrmB
VAQNGISRRTALVGGLGLTAAAGLAAAGYGLVEAGTLPGKYRLAQLTGACGAPPAPPGGPRPARQQLEFWSAYRRRRVTMVILRPAGAGAAGVGAGGAGGTGVVLALHGLGADASSSATMLAPAMTAAGTAVPVLTVDGGSTYWHRRADGDDPQGMILHEVLPRAAAMGLGTGRIGILGDSMGGYGALLLAERLGTATGGGATGSGTAGAGPAGAGPKIAAVAALAPAIFPSYADARRADRRAFDGAADFARNDVLSGISALRDVPSYIACGSSDPFEPMAGLLRSRLRRLRGREPAGGIEAGCHDNAFWARHFPGALAFVGARLA